jgi:transposase InsO family protein
VKSGNVILVGTMRKNLYYLDNVTSHPPVVPTKVYHTTNSEITLDLMHRRLGHLSMRAVKQLFKKNMVQGITLSNKHLNSDPSLCECCIRGKMQRTPLPKSSSRNREVLDLVHSDLWGPAPVMSLGGKYYFITFTDDSGRYSWVYYLRQKKDAFDAFKAWHQEVERQTGRKLQVFRSDNGSEYVNHKWELYLKEHGIIHQRTTPRTPEQNGVSERLNLTIMDRVRTILIESRLPLSLWAEAVSYAVYTKNRSPTTSIKGRTPYEVFWGEKPDISNLRVFGSQCYVHNNSPARRKLDARAFPAVFIGYPPEIKAWKYYIPKSRKAGVSRNIIFDERVRSATQHLNIEGESTATKTSTYSDLLVPTVSNSYLDDDDYAPRPPPEPPPPPHLLPHLLLLQGLLHLRQHQNPLRCQPVHLHLHLFCLLSRRHLPSRRSDVDVDLLRSTQSLGRPDASKTLKSVRKLRLRKQKRTTPTKRNHPRRTPARS